MPSIEEHYVQKFRRSLKWYERGKSLFPGGITHQTRFNSPFPVYFEHASGPFKYDVDGHEIVDHVMGSGSLLMGHSPPEVTEAMNAQSARGTHLGGATTHEVRYAEAIKRLMPSLERVRFTTSGTEAKYEPVSEVREVVGRTVFGVPLR